MLLSEADREKVRQALSSMTSPVRLVFFTQTLNCETCLPTRQILDEIASISDQVTVQEHNFLLDKDKVAEYAIERVPAVAVVNGTDPGIRFYGAPSGYEFASLIEAIVMVSRGSSQLSPATIEILKAVDRPISIQVFVTPT
jgi:glutaredoxin-like protein